MIIINSELLTSDQASAISGIASIPLKYFSKDSKIYAVLNRSGAVGHGNDLSWDIAYYYYDVTAYVLAFITGRRLPVIDMNLLSSLPISGEVIIVDRITKLLMDNLSKSTHNNRTPHITGRNPHLFEVRANDISIFTSNSDEELKHAVMVVDDNSTLYQVKSATLVRVVDGLYHVELKADVRHSRSLPQGRLRSLHDPDTKMHMYYMYGDSSGGLHSVTFRTSNIKDVIRINEFVKVAGLSDRRFIISDLNNNMLTEGSFVRVPDQYVRAYYGVDGDVRRCIILTFKEVYSSSVVFTDITDNN